MYFTKEENQFQLFNCLIPFTVVAPLNIFDEELDLARMYRAKFLFDKAVLNSRNILVSSGDVSVDGKFVGSINV